MRFILIGNGRPAFRALKALEAAGQRDVLCFTEENEKGPFARHARKLGLPLHPEKEIRTLVRGEKPVADWLLCCSSTMLIPVGVLERISGGAINFHPGKLPEYAGLYTFQWAIRDGCTEAGVTLHFMEAGLDTGDIVMEETLSISPTETGLSLYNRCLKSGASMMANLVEKIVADEPLPRKPQDLSRRRLYRRADALNGNIDWTWSATEITNFARAADYYPMRSPSYSAIWKTPSGTEVTVLTTEPCSVSPPLSTGAVRTAPDLAPLVGCGVGDGEAVRITRAVFGTTLIEAKHWPIYLNQDGR